MVKSSTGGKTDVGDPAIMSEVSTWYRRPFCACPLILLLPDSLGISITPACTLAGNQNTITSAVLSDLGNGEGRSG